MIAMSKNWEDMTAKQRLSWLRSEVESLGRITDTVSRRIEEIRGELNAIESKLDERSLEEQAP
jgi:hypothetical protein